MRFPHTLSASAAAHPFNALTLAVASLALGALSAQATAFQFSNASGGDYQTATNWTPNGVPNLSTGDTAQIANGSAVTYNPGGDLIISNGGILQVTSGSFTQINGGAYIQLGLQGNGAATGNGTILVNGGTFNQGTASSNPFAVTGTGNAFTITSGAANFTRSVAFAAGITYTQSGGTVTVVSGAEFDFNNATSTLSGGILNTSLITGNNVDGTRFNISGGMLNLGSATDSRFIYAGSATRYINLAAGSTGVINFNNANATLSQIQGFVTSNKIQYNDTPNAGLSNFNITQTASGYSLSLAGVASPVPEPSSMVLGSVAMAGLVVWLARRRLVTA